MFWLIGVAVLIFLIFFIFLLSAIVIEVDTRVPQAGIRWGSLGKAKIWYNNEWWLSVQLLFYRKTIQVTGIKSKANKTVAAIAKKKPKKKLILKKFSKKIFPIIKTFKTLEWILAIDTGDNVYNAQLYPLNFLSKTYGHVFINFNNENFLVLKIRNYPWQILYSLLK